MANQHQGMVIRPPSEAKSFLLQATYGCSHNRCAFCLTYKFNHFAARPFDKIREDIELASRYNPSIRRVFLCDGNAMCLSTEELSTILDCLADKFPRLDRVGIYANAPDILSKTPEELSLLRENKLGIAYLGLESGNDEILQRMNKGSTSEEMVQAVVKARNAGISMSVIVLLGLGSNKMSYEHALDSARAVSRMNPEYLSALTLMLLPGTPLFKWYKKGEFELMSPITILDELRNFIENVEVDNCVFRTNHASNYLPLMGVLSKDRSWMLDVIDMGLADDSILRPETHRAL